MRNAFIFIIFILISITTFGQSRQASRGIGDNDSNLEYDSRADSIQNKKSVNVLFDGVTHYTDYKIILHNYDTIYIDTTLNINKNYILNF